MVCPTLRLPIDQAPVSGDGHGLEPRADSQIGHDSLDVAPDSVRAQG